MGDQDNQRESPTRRSSLIDQAVVSQAMRSRLGALKEQFSVPDDVDRMGQKEIAPQS